MSRNMRIVFFIVLVGIFLIWPLIRSDSVTAAPKHLIKFATVAPEGTTWMKHMRRLEKEITKKSNGQLGFSIFPGAVAGDEIDVLRRMRIGQIHAAGFSGVGFGQILPMVRVLDLPFLFRNYEETDRVHREMRQRFAEEFLKRGFQLLAWAEVGNAHIFSKRPIRTVKDLAGLKVWAWSGDPIAKETFAAMGINPIPLAITDVTTSIGTGMIDTVYAPPLGALALQWHTSMKYMTSLPLAHSSGAILISQSHFKKLPQDLANMLRSNFERAMKELTLALRAQNEETINVIREKGLTILPMPSGPDLEAFYAIHGKVAKKLTGKLYPQEILDQVYKILERSP